MTVLVPVLLGGLAGFAVDRLAAGWIGSRSGGASSQADGAIFEESRLVAGPRRLWLLPVLALVVAGLYARFGWSPTLAVATLDAAILALLATIDLEQRRVPNAITGPAALATLVLSVVSPGLSLPGALLGGALGFALFAGLAIVRPGAIGGGDVKLAGLVGLMVGFPLVIPALVVGILAGGVIALGLLLSRSAGRRSRIAYAPALALGGLAALIYGPQMLAWMAR